MKILVYGAGVLGCNLHKQSPHLYSILIRRKCPLSALKIFGCII